MNKLFIFSWILCVLAFSGCSTISSWRDNLALKAGYQKKTQIENEISQLKADYQVKADAQAKAVSDAKDAQIAAIKAQLLKAVSGFYGADASYHLLLTPNRSDQVINNFVNEGWAALGYQMPDYQTMLDVNARLKDDLDETKTTLLQLQQEHAKAMTDNKVLSDKETAVEAQVKTLADAKAQLDATYHQALEQKQTAQAQADQGVIALEHARADDAKAHQAMLTKASMILGGLALAMLAGAIWSPVFKSQFGLAAGLLGFIALGIWYVTPAIVGGIGAALVLGLVGWAVYQHYIESKTALATYQGLAEAADKQPAAMAAIAPVLASFQTTYTKAPDGTVTTKPDPSIPAHIDAKLMAVGDK